MVVMDLFREIAAAETVEEEFFLLSTLLLLFSRITLSDTRYLSDEGST